MGGILAIRRGGATPAGSATRRKGGGIGRSHRRAPSSPTADHATTDDYSPAAAAIAAKVTSFQTAADNVRPAAAWQSLMLAVQVKISAQRLCADES
jgi:hypothetical protein